MKKIIECINRNYNVLTLVISAMIGVGTIMIGYVTIGVMKDQMRLQAYDNQPIFRIETELVKVTNENFYDGEFCRIFNDGSPVVQFDNLVVNTIIEFEININDKRNILLTSFYDASFETSNLKGEIETYYGQNCNKYFYDLCQDALKQGYFIKRFNIYQISYLDIYNKPQVSYYKGNKRISKDEYFAIVDSCDYKNQYSANIGELTINKILAIIQSHDKE